MKFQIQNFNEITPLYFSVVKEKLEIIRLLLAHPKIDINRKYII